ncbi:hypothetical protein PISMIDRAFT_20454 [Pisolithus microcarpus 441]|uniref:Uncharacterized protein n=1 Tax=Pisolithus microcarpus 441 TaxID=765257 RepID=A0A0C9XZQ3_9AGAM|nr:hypothetical protein PISMIDRAFT_20454 [Pisolithus microcarpus 441]
MAVAAHINTAAHLALAYQSIPSIPLMPAVRSCTQTPKRSPRNSQPRPKPAPSAPSTITADCCSDDLPQKIAQILQYFEEEVVRSWEETRAAEEARVAAEKAKSDAMEAEEQVRKRVQLVGIDCLRMHATYPSHSSSPPCMRER